MTGQRRIVAGVFLALCGLVAMSRCPVGTFSTKELDPSFVEIKRPRYWLRHLKWSGIFPREGGLHRDPEVVATEVFTLPDELRQRLGAKSGRFQGFDVNPWFHDRTSEIVLAIELDGVVHQYRIANSTKPRLDYGFINFYAPIVPFAYNDRLAFATGLSISRLAFLSTALPLRGDGEMEPVFEGSEAFDAIVQYLRAEGRYVGLRDQLCGAWKPYREFYKRFEPCPPRQPWKPTDRVGS